MNNKLMKAKTTVKIWLLTAVIGGITYVIIWAIARLTSFENEDIYEFDWYQSFWKPVPLLAGLFFLLILGLPMFILKEKRGRKLALLAGCWLFYLPILRGSILPSIIGLVSAMLLPFGAGSFVILFGLPFSFSQTEVVEDWIQVGHLEPNLTAAQALIATGVAITIVGFVQILRVLREKRLLTEGLYATVRHPQQLGIALWTLGFAIGIGRTIGFMAWFTIVYFYVLLAIREERQLAEQFGETYQVYRRNTPFMIPIIHKGLPLPAGGWKRIGALIALYVVGLAILCLILNLVGVSRVTVM